MKVVPAFLRIVNPWLAKHWLYFHNKFTLLIPILCEAVPNKGLKPLVPQGSILLKLKSNRCKLQASKNQLVEIKSMKLLCAEFPSLQNAW
jgi:hypothetical protein